MGPRHLVIALLTTLGCSGVSLGDPGEPSSIPRCSEQSRVPITDASLTAEGFEASTAELLAPTHEVLTGTLELADGSSAPVRVELSIKPGSLVAVYAEDPNFACPPWHEASVLVDIDAGDALRGQADGTLYVRDPTQVRGEWSSLDRFQTRLSTPTFDGEPTDTALIVYLLQHDDGDWDLSIQFAARVAQAPCDPERSMCPGGPGGTTPDYRPAGEAELRPEETP